MGERMFTKKNKAIMFGVIVQMVFSACAMEQESLRDLYKKLLQVQGLKDPSGDVNRLGRMDCAPSWYLNTLLTNAKTTGLIKQYQDVLSTEIGANVLSFMFEAPCLRNAAYLQNKYGKGNPFVYNGAPDQQDVAIGQYDGPRGMITITRYSFINGVLEQADTAGAQLGGNQNFQKSKATLRNSLMEAIKQAEAVIAAQNSPAKKFSWNLDTIKEFGDVLVKMKDEPALINLNNQLETVIKNFQ